MHSSFLLTAVLLAQVSAAPILQAALKPLQQSVDSIVSKLQQAKVIPDVLPPTFAPTYSLTLTFPTSHSTVSLGNLIPVAATTSRPVFQITPLALPSTLSPTRTLSQNKTYTLVLSDPDATSHSNPVKAQMCHWIATGIRRAGTNASEDADQDAYALELRSLVRVVTGHSEHASPAEEDAVVGGEVEEEAAVEELVEYMAPAPPPKTGRHRYVFVLMEPDEDSGRGGKEIKAPRERPRFGYKKQGKGVGEWARDNGLKAVAANFFYAENEKQ